MSDEKQTKVPMTATERKRKQRVRARMIDFDKPEILPFTSLIEALQAAHTAKSSALGLAILDELKARFKKM